MLQSQLLLEQKDSGRQVDEAFQCSICLSEYTDPRALPCLHTFCAACIHGLNRDYSGITCPMCRCKHRVPDLSNLPKNFYLDQLREAASGSKSPTPVPSSQTSSCAECPNRPVAFCDCCSGALCLRHLNSHSELLLADCKNVIKEADEAIQTGKQSEQMISNDLKQDLESLSNKASLADSILASLSDLIAERRQLIASQSACLANKMRHQNKSLANSLAQLSIASRNLTDTTDRDDLRTAKEGLDKLRRLLTSFQLDCQRPSLLNSFSVDLDALAKLEVDLKAATAFDAVVVNNVEELEAAESAVVEAPQLPSASQPIVVESVEQASLPFAPTAPRALPCDFRPVDLAIAAHLPAPLWCHPELGIAASIDVNQNDSNSWRLLPRQVLACISDAGDLHFLDGTGRHLTKLALPGVKASRLCECQSRGALVLADSVSGTVRLWLPPKNYSSATAATSALFGADANLGDISAVANVWQPRGLAYSKGIIYVACPGAVQLIDAVTMTTRSSIRRPFKSADAVAAWADGSGFVVSDCAEGRVHLFGRFECSDCQHLGSFACRDVAFLEVGCLSSARLHRGPPGSHLQQHQQRRSAKQLFASRSRRHSVIGVDLDGDMDDADGLPRELTLGADAKGGAPGQVNCPLGLRFDAASACLYVCDFYNYRLQVFPV